MKVIKSYISFISIVTLCQALTYAISGIIKNSAGNGIEGGMVRLNRALSGIGDGRWNVRHGNDEFLW